MKKPAKRAASSEFTLWAKRCMKLLHFEWIYAKLMVMLPVTVMKTRDMRRLWYQKERKVEQIYDALREFSDTCSWKAKDW